MSWVKEKIMILIMSTPETSSKYGHVICTAGITENNEWRRLWSITPQIKKKYKIKRWDIIEANVRTTNDKRIETRKIDEDSIKNYSHIHDWNHKSIIEEIADNSLDDIINAGRSIGILKPNIKRLKLIPSITKDDKSFGKVFPKYHFKCDTQCSMCSSQYAYHKMKCRDWGSNVLCRKVKNKPNGNDIIKQKLFNNMKNNFDTWFGIGTHRRWQTWMIVGLFWFKKEGEIKKQRTKMNFKTKKVKAMKYTKLCPYCNKEFETDISYKKFCCEEHQHMYNFGSKVGTKNFKGKNLKCKECGESFTQIRPNQKYCKIECRKDYYYRQ